MTIVCLFLVSSSNLMMFESTFVVNLRVNVLSTLDLLLI